MAGRSVTLVVSFLALALLALGAASAQLPAAPGGAEVKSSGVTYPTIQDAVDAAAPGDVILVRPGTYAAFDVAGKDGLTLCASPEGSPVCGAGVAADTIVDGAGGAYAVRIASRDVELRDMTIRNGGGEAAGGGIVVTGAAARLEGNVIEGAPVSTAAGAVRDGVRLDAPDALVRGNAIRNWAGAGLALGAAGGPARVYDNAFDGNGAHLRDKRADGTLDVRQNVFAGALEAAVVYASPMPATLRDNAFDAGAPAIEIASGADGALVDARANDWGVYGRDVVAGRFAGAAENGAPRFMPYRDDARALHPRAPSVYCWFSNGNASYQLGAAGSQLDLVDATTAPLAAPCIASEGRIVELWDDVEAYDGAELPSLVTLRPGAGQLAPRVLAPEGGAALRIVGDDVTVEGIVIESGAAGETVGVRIEGDRAALLGARLLGPAPAENVAGQHGVLVTGDASGWRIEGNEIAGWGAFGVYVGGSAGAGSVVDNVVVDASRALHLEGDAGQGALVVARNDLRGHRDMNVRVDTDRAIEFRENALGAAPRTLSFTARFPGATFDARANDWGVVGRDAVLATVEDEGRHPTRVVPYLDAAGALHPPMVDLRCAQDTGPWASTYNAAQAWPYLGIGDALAHECPAAYPVRQVSLYRDAEAYEGATVDVPAYVADAAGSFGVGARIGAPSYFEPGLRFVAGSEGSMVEGLVFDVDAGATGVVVEGIPAESDSLVYLYQNEFVGLGTGVAARDGKGPAIQFNRFAGLAAPVVFDNTTGGNVWSNELVAGVGSSAAVEVRDATDAWVRANTIETHPSGTAVGVWIEDSVAPLVLGNSIVANPDASSAGVSLRHVAGANVTGNRIVDAALGVHVYESEPAVVDGNTILSPAGATGIHLWAGASHVLTGNTIVGGLSGVTVTNAPDVTIDGLVVSGAATGVTVAKHPMSTQQSTPLDVHDSRLAGAGTALALGSTVFGVAVDATCNDWGAYSVATIPTTRIRDEGRLNSVQFQPYTSADSEGLGCLTMPVAAIGADVHGRVVAFTDESAPGSRPIVLRSWDFGDGATSADEAPTHAYERFGSYLVRLTVTDLDGNEATALLPIEVANRAPVLMPVGDRALDEGATLAFTLAASDADGDALRFGASGLPAGATLDAQTGAFAWTPPYGAHGAYDVAFRVTDGDLVDEETVTLTVVDVDPAPVFAAVPGQVLLEGGRLELRVSAADLEGAPVTVAAEGWPAGATVAQDGADAAVLTWMPSYDSAGRHEAAFVASDGARASRLVVPIHVLEGNGVPGFAPVADRALAEGEAVQFVVSALDPNGDELAFGASDLPAGASFDAAKRVFRWTPTHEQAGAHVVTFLASDGANVAQERVTLSIADVNRAPVLGDLAARVVLANRTLAFALPASDPDGDALAFELLDGPDGATLEGAVVIWRPAPEQVGSHALAFRASDDDASATGIVAVTVVANGAPAVELALPARVEAGLPFAASVTATDPEGGNVTVEWDFDHDGATFRVDATGENATWSYGTLAPRNVLVRVTDEDGFVAYANGTVIVDDRIVLELRILEGAPDASTGTHAHAKLTWWDGTPVADHALRLASFWRQPGTNAAQTTHEFTIRTGADGGVTFVVPRDTPFGNLPGAHTLVARTLVEDTWLGDDETGHASAGYSVSW